MWLNLFKISYRTLLKNRLFSIINILGLAFGLLCSMFMALWVWDELQYDQFHINSDNIYQVLGDVHNNGESKIREYVPSALAGPMLQNFPEITQVTRVFGANVVFEANESKFSESGIYVDSSFVQMFTFPLIEGKPEGLLDQPQSIAISETLAQKYFPGESALGKNIVIVEKKKLNYVIRGVFKPAPPQSSFQFDFLMSYDRFESEHRPWWSAESNKNAYTNFNMHTYITLVPGANINELNGKLETFITDFSGIDTDDALFVFPFSEYYLHSDFSQGRIPTGKIQYVNLLSVVALIVLLIACINFMNLSTARAGKRAKEVGLRKTIGATKPQLLSQFLVESILIALIAMLIAITLADLLMPAFNFLTQKQISIPFGSIGFIATLFLVAIGTGVVAGCYPALYMSAFSPAKTLKTSTSSKGGLTGMRKGLVIVQFSLSMIFIVFTIVVSNQIDFIQNKDLGIRRDNIVRHSLNGIKKNKQAYKAELLGIPGVQSVVFSEQDPFNVSNANQGVSWKGKPENEDLYFNVLQVSEGFIETFDIELLAGTTFPKDFNPQAKKHFIINEAAAWQMMAEDPIGMELKVWGFDGTVVGLAKDFHHRSFKHAIEPLVIVCNPDETYNAYISIGDGNTSETVNNISTVYSKLEPDYGFNYAFVEDQQRKSYGEVITIGRLANLFSAAAIFISCLGLFGLSSFITEQRTKETGIRKVLGASEFGLLYLFSIGFVKLVLLAFAIALPAAWFYSSYWLADYTYHVELGPAPFVIAGVSAVAIALLTVSYNTIRAASANPVDSLKYE